MRYLSILLIIMFILLSSGCKSNDAPDINEFAELLNENESINISISSIITVRKNHIEYSYFYNEHILFQAYADDSGRIIACCITGDRQDSNAAYELFEAALKALCKYEGNIQNELTANEILNINGWSCQFNENSLSDYYIIYNDNFKFNSEDLPKIKNFIRNN